MRVIVPFDGQTPKTRLSSVLDYGERKAFARAMLRDVLTTIRAVGADPLVLSPSAVPIEDCSVWVDERSLSTAVNAQLRAATSAAAVVMADLPLLTERALERLLTSDGDVVLARGTGGGTNALVSRTGDFAVDYHGNSYLDHLTAAREVDAALTEVDSYRLATDIDEPDDLAELLLHGDGLAADWLRDSGFRLSSDGGQSAVRRAAVAHGTSR
jgi:2-phospho-L-lactate guanylyltransferase